MDDSEFPFPHERGAGRGGRGRRGDMPAPAGRGGRGDHERSPRGLEALDKTSVAVFEGVWKGESAGGRGGRGRGGGGRGGGGRGEAGRGGGGRDGGGRGGRGGGRGGAVAGRGYHEEEEPAFDHHPEDPYWAEELLPQYAPPPAARRGELCSAAYLHEISISEEWMEAVELVKASIDDTWKTPARY